MLRRRAFPACATLKLPNATWLTFRRTYASWAHERRHGGRLANALDVSLAEFFGAPG